VFEQYSSHGWHFGISIRFRVVDERFLDIPHETQLFGLFVYVGITEEIERFLQLSTFSKESKSTRSSRACRLDKT